jgi:predicted negative regulator of RcsB-dependent stress response
MSKETIEILAQLGTIVAAIATVVAVGFAYWAAWEARNAAKASRAAVEAQIVYSAMSDYFQPTMAEALRTLRAWVEKQGDNFATVWLEEFKQRKPEAVEVDGARRQLKGFFVKATRLHSGGLIGDELSSFQICNREGSSESSRRSKRSEDLR